MPSVVAVASVVAIVVAMVAFFAAGDDSTTTEARGASSSQRSAPTAEPDGPPTAARTPEAEKPDPTQAAVKRDKQNRPRTRDTKPRRQKRAEPTPEVPQVYVEVYNNTSIDGLAASTAAELQDAGWQVVGVDNWYGNIPASTVYHPDGLTADAHQLAEELSITRVRGAVAPMRFDRLTVILTEDAY
jgi:hypothetical protein